MPNYQCGVIEGFLSGHFSYNQQKDLAFPFKLSRNSTLCDIMYIKLATRYSKLQKGWRHKSMPQMLYELTFDPILRLAFPRLRSTNKGDKSNCNVMPIC